MLKNKIEKVFDKMSEKAQTQTEIDDDISSEETYHFTVIIQNKKNGKQTSNDFLVKRSLLLPRTQKRFQEELTNTVTLLAKSERFNYLTEVQE